MTMNDLISRAQIKHERDLVLDQARKAMPCTGEDEELDHGARMYQAGIQDLARRLLALPAASQPEAEPVIMQGMSDDTTGLARFGHHPDPAIDFCVEVETLESRLHQAEHGLSKPGTEPETVAAVLVDIQRAMDFRVGGDEGAVNAKHVLRELEARATPAPAAQEAEPVAWRWRWNGGDEPDIWAYREDPIESDQHRTIQPLYAHPPAPVVLGEELEWALCNAEAAISGYSHLAKNVQYNLAVPINVGQLRDMIAALRAQQPAAPVSGVTVKPLVWEEEAGRSYRQANCIFGQYQISWLVEFECWQLSRPHMAGREWRDGFSRHSSKDDAKAAAQADYEDRILSALEVK